jgi:hypothetical protein
MIINLISMKQTIIFPYLPPGDLPPLPLPPPLPAGDLPPNGMTYDNSIRIKSEIKMTVLRFFYQIDF